MRCMKTGLCFNVPVFNDDTYHADLFYNETAGVAIIRGLGAAVSTQAPDMKLEPNGDAFAVVGMTPALKEQLAKYYSYVDMHLVHVIIDDTKFF